MADPDPIATAERLKIPIFHGDPGKDYFSVEAWTARVTKNKENAVWDDDTTMSNVFNSLRGRALSWHMVMAAREIPDFEVWDTYKALFVEAFSPAKTSKAVIGIFNGLSQQASEGVIDFFNRVGKASDDITSLRPALPAPRAADWQDEVRALAGWGALHADIKRDQARKFMRMGAKADVEHVATQLFIAGLKPSIRDPFLAQAPADGFDSLWKACQAALDVEKNTRDQAALVKQLQPMGAVAAVNANEDNKEKETNDSTEAVAAISEASEAELAVLKKFGFRSNNRGRGRGSRGRGGGGRGNSANGGSGKFDPNQCVACGKYGHWKRDCRSSNNTNNGGRNNGKPPFKVHATSADNQGQQQPPSDNPPGYEAANNPFVGSLSLNYQ